jgi:hypothetical protein
VWQLLQLPATLASDDKAESKVLKAKSIRQNKISIERKVKVVEL